MRPLPVLYEDDEFVVVDKPAGVPVHGGAKVEKKTVLERFAAPMFPVHRLDAGTSGVLVLARTKSAAAAAAARWAEADKTYFALVFGVARSGVIDAPLTAPDGRAQTARTIVQHLATSPDAGLSLVAARLETGRTHQIRRHLAGAGHPIVMDDKYGDFPANKRFRARMREAGAPSPKHPLLHACALTWPRGRVVAPLPDRWVAWLRAVGLDPEVLAH